MTIWIILRAAGIGAYLMLFLAVSWGLTATAAPLGKRIAKASATSVHQFMATTGLVLLAIHVGGLLLDSYMPFHPKDVLVPGHTSFKTAPVAVGIVAMYALVFVIAASWMRRALGTTWWRRTHLLAVPTFTLALVHGLFTGTDSGRPWMWWMYLATGLTVFFLVALRGLTVGFRPQRATHPSHLPRARPVAEEAREPIAARR